MQKQFMRTRALLLALTLALVGCQPPAGAPPVTSGDPQIILGQNALISNNTASLSGTVMGPASLISNAGASYRIQAAVEMGPVQQAMVYLTTPDERFYAGADGKALFAMTDDQGRYAFAKAPGEEPVVVTVLLANNRRLVGFLIPAKGENTYHVNLATTVIAEFLRDHAHLGHKTMADFPKFHEKLPQIMAMTQELIDNGKLVVEDISMTSIPEMRHAYVRAFGKDYEELSNAWEEVLGYRPYLIEDYDVAASEGMNVVAVTTDPQTEALYVAAESNTALELFEYKNATRRTLFKGDVVNNGLARPSSLHVSGGKLYVGAPGVLDPDPLYRFGGLSVFDISQTQPEGHADPLSFRTHFIEKGAVAGGPAEAWIGASAVAVDGDKVYVTSDLTDEVYRYEIDWNAGSFVNGELLMGSSNGNWTATSKFDAAHDSSTLGKDVTLNFPIGVTKVGNNLYVSDSSNHRVRKLDLTTGYAETVLGLDNKTPYGNILKPPTALEDGKLADSADKGFVDIDYTGGVPVAKAHLSYPHTVVMDAEGNMLVADTDHRRVRILKKDGKVYTLAGTVAGATEANGDSRRAGIGEVWGMAIDHEGNLLIADAKSNKLRRLWLKPKSKQN